MNRESKRRGVIPTPGKGFDSLEEQLVYARSFREPYQHTLEYRLAKVKAAREKSYNRFVKQNDEEILYLESRIQRKQEKQARKEEPITRVSELEREQAELKRQLEDLQRQLGVKPGANSK